MKLLPHLQKAVTYQEYSRREEEYHDDFMMNLSLGCKQKKI